MFGEKHWNREAIKCLDTLTEGMVSNDDSITVSSTWELSSVYMRYSQGDGVNTSLYRLMYCTHVLLSRLSTCLLYCVILLYPRHDHVLSGTIKIKMMCVHRPYLQG